jgi:phosphotransferase system enzyme I (PtsI)
MIGELDFISIGTNDLIQYLMAVDRVNQEVAHLYDPCHPAVARTLNLIIQTAHKRGKTVSICGEIASDTKMLPLLLGLNVDALSVTPRMFLRVKNNIRNSDFEHCSDLAQAALLMGSSDDIRKLFEQNNENENP